MFLKDTAGQIIHFVAVATDGTPATSGVSVWLAQDDGAQATAAGTLTHLGNGQWRYEPTQAESNCDALGVAWGGSGIVPGGFPIYPTTVPADLEAVKASTDLISDGVQIQTSQILTAGDLLELHKGASYQDDMGTAFTIYVPASDVDLTDREGRFAMFLQTDEEDVTETLTKAVDVKDAGGPNQRIVVELTKTETDGLGVDPDPTPPFGLEDAAYLYQIGYAETNDACAVAVEGQASVRELHLDCSGVSAP